MRTKLFGLFCIYAVAATATFLLMPGRAAKATQAITVSGYGCTNRASIAICPIPGGSPVSDIGGISDVFFDYYGNGSTTLTFFKLTYSGTGYSDAISVTDPSGANVEQVVTSNHVKNSGLSAWDYYFATFDGPNFRTDATKVIGVGVWEGS